MAITKVWLDDGEGQYCTVCDQYIPYPCEREKDVIVKDIMYTIKEGQEKEKPSS